MSFTLTDSILEMKGGVRTMKAKLLICFLTIGFVLGLAAMSLAKVSGPCVNCHTMHDSQGGLPVNKNAAGQPIGPQGALIKNDCLGCHTTTGSDPLVNGYPFVRGNGFNDNVCLAGGFFPMDSDGTDNLGKAHSLNSKAKPPGYNGSWYKGQTNGLTCSGSSGCHGSQTIDDPMGAIRGGHHSPDPGLYRILYAYDGTTAKPVTGVGAADYEKLLNTTTAPSGPYDRTDATYAHNVYIAVAGTTTDTISKLCANCHGDFHGAGTGTKSPWTRHPSDVKLPGAWDPANDAISSNVDCKYNPFGFGSEATNTAGPKYVTCLSCHRAHGTASYDLLRFAYNSSLGDVNVQQSAGSTNMFGCLGCHSGQRR